MGVGVSKIVGLDGLCESIMDMDRNVSSVVVINQKGTVLQGSLHDKLVQPSLERWNDIHFMECILEISMGGKFDELYGPIRYHHSEKDNFIMFSFPLYQHFILVTCTKKISPIAFATKISHLIYRLMIKILHK